ncbi:MAG: hypothetical protein UHD09_02065 [Bifidobacterium sp.]|nr:hypothetical protein [Bifidobacterium sp.]
MPHRIHTPPRVIAGVLALAAITTLSACGQQQTTAEPVAFDMEHPNFSGANAATYQHAWENTDSDTVRKMLIDEVITDAEFEEARRQYTLCMEDKGYTVEFYGDKGERSERGSADKVDLIEDDIKQCQAQTGLDYIELLHGLNGYDPGQDTVEPLLDCLKRHGIADQDMTAEQYKDIVSDTAMDAYHFGKYFDQTRADYDAEKSPAYWACNTDPTV